MKIQKCLVVLLVMTLALSSPVLAGSRSASIRVSCTILPALEIASAPQAAPAAFTETKSELALAAQNTEVSVNTNLGNQFNLTQQIVKTDIGLTKLYSVTAL